MFNIRYQLKINILNIIIFVKDSIDYINKSYTLDKDHKWGKNIIKYTYYFHITLTFLCAIATKYRSFMFA